MSANFQMGEPRATFGVNPLPKQSFDQSIESALSSSGITAYKQTSSEGFVLLELPGEAEPIKRIEPVIKGLQLQGFIPLLTKPDLPVGSNWLSLIVFTKDKSDLYSLVVETDKPPASLPKKQIATGLALVLLGPDGVGKTTLIEQLRYCLRPIFPLQKLWHWRPGVLLRAGAGRPLGKPHSRPLRGKIASVLYLSAVFVDCWIGYLLVIRPLLAKKHLLVFDRYFPDILVDPRRYRYSGPMLYAELLASLAPGRNFHLFVLDADEKVIRSRKQELDIDEIRRQRTGYTQLGKDANAIVLRTDLSPPVEAVRKAAAHLLDQISPLVENIPVAVPRND